MKTKHAWVRGGGAVLVWVCSLSAIRAVEFEWVAVGDGGNPADTAVMNDGTSGYGSVGYTYRISKTEVTNTQYAAFLNAVAQSDPFELYLEITEAFPEMMGIIPPRHGITRSGQPGTYVYNTIPGREHMPVVYVSYNDTLRFANWLHNGQGSGDTESGAYDMTLGDAVVRSPDAAYFLPNENEWYKAAYYDPTRSGGGGYWRYATGSDTVDAQTPPGSTARSANILSTVDEFTDVGSYPDSLSAYGTLDQTGNVWEWSETVDDPEFPVVGRGGGYNIEPSIAGSTFRIRERSFSQFIDTGFRVGAIAEVPQPAAVGLWVALGCIAAVTTARHTASGRPTAPRR